MYNAADMSELMVNAFSAEFVEVAAITAQRKSFAVVLDEVYVSPESYGYVWFEQLHCC